MTHSDTYDAIKTHIEASAPCTLQGVLLWASQQGLGGSKAIQTINTLRQNKTIETSLDDEGSIIVDLL